MKFHKFISVILHPIVIPTVGVMLYFLLIKNNLDSNQKIAVLALIFTATYLIPLLILIVFKKLNLIQSYYLKTIKERKIPLAIMITLFYLLGNTMNNIPHLRDLGLLFFATALGLVLIYVTFSFHIKTSIHLLSTGISLGFFLVLGNIYAQNFLLVIIVILLFSGVLGSSRLYLNAHSSKEIYLGFFFGIISPFLVYYIL